MKPAPTIKETRPLPLGRPSPEQEKAAVAAVLQAIEATREGRDFTDEALFEVIFGDAPKAASDSGESQDATRSGATTKEPSNAMDH